MVYRIFVEKKTGLANAAAALASDLELMFGIRAGVRIVNRYDVEGITPELFERAVDTVFSEPQTDDTNDEIEAGTSLMFAVEYLPGQFDQRADSAAQCIQIISQGARPTVRTAKVYLLDGITEAQLEIVKKYVINPVESREASLDLPATLASDYAVPGETEIVHGFIAMDDGAAADFIKKYALAMDENDVRFCRDYFRREGRDPTITEIRMIDTYWSDHCRHTTFQTEIDGVQFEDETLRRAWERYIAARGEAGRAKKPKTLMDIATVAAKLLKTRGLLTDLDESEEINACTVKVKVDIDGEAQDWLLLFKNETHNHPTEIEPFGGAATCIGGAIRDPLSGRAYVCAAMRVTGAADPTRPVSETIPGKLPQRKLVTTAANGYSSYGNQIGLATGQVDEIYHDGYAAKRMEIGAVVAATPEENVRREVPLPGDKVILLGGRTGRDGCGGATGSSKSHTQQSLETCGAEVQKGNAPEERKLQRLFRSKEASRLIKRCNDFGAGGVSVAVGELADGLMINLDKVPLKYDGLDGTETAISESQERMAVVVAPSDVSRFCEIAEGENLEATVIAEVTESPRLVMNWRGHAIVDVSREFLDSNGASRHITPVSSAPKPFARTIPDDFADGMTALAGDLNVCSKRGLSERFDSTIGAGSVLMPFGGTRQLTPAQAMAHKIPTEHGDTTSCSVMAYGFNPYISEKSPYHGAYLAVVESVSKLIAAGAPVAGTHLTFQEYFEKPGFDGKRWGKPLSALLGAFDAQVDLGIAAIGGKDSMSGSFESLDVPPTLVSFAVGMTDTRRVISDEFKAAGHRVMLITPEYTDNSLPLAKSLMAVYNKVEALIKSGAVISAYTPCYGGIAEGIMKMCLGNGLGFAYDKSVTHGDIFAYRYGSFIIEIADGADTPALCADYSVSMLGMTTNDNALTLGNEAVSMDTLTDAYENRLESVFPCGVADVKCDRIPALKNEVTTRVTTGISIAKPRVLIPVFPGTNCEYDSAKAWERAGATPETFVIRNLTPDAVTESVKRFAESVKQSQIIFIPGGFSGGDEPDGSGKFITAFFRNAQVTDAVMELLKSHDGLIGGICNGFQALIKLGLVPYGEIRDADAKSPTLTFNTISRHQSKIVRIRVASDMSPWLSSVKVGDVFSVPVSHGEGRFIADDETVVSLAAHGQIMTQYVDDKNEPTYDIRYNPNGSVYAVEGITSPDGRVFGKMGHSERIGRDLYKNVPGNYDMKLFESAVKYYK